MLLHRVSYNAFFLAEPIITWLDAAVYYQMENPWWRHQMKTFSALLALCAGNSPVTGEFPAQGPVTQIFDILFDLRLNTRLSVQL